VSGIATCASVELSIVHARITAHDSVEESENSILRMTAPFR
jgi:hypothetical protein